MEMKYIIVHLHSSNENLIRYYLNELNIKICNIFRTSETNKYTNSNIIYTIDDVNQMFENNSYIILDRLTNKDYYEGISKYDYEDSDVLLLTPKQFNNIDINKDDCIIWLDDTLEFRYENYHNSSNHYDFLEEENIEKYSIKECIDKIYKYDYIYFSNELPERISTIIYSLIKHPELIDLYKLNFK